MGAKPFEVRVTQQALDDLRDRLERTRWVDEVEDEGWDHGTNGSYLRDLVGHWLTHFDWRQQEQAINRFSHFRADVDGVGVHFIHQRGKGERPLPIILTHGYPDSFVRFLKIIPMLSDPQAHGGDAADAFDVVVPSLPASEELLDHRGGELRSAPLEVRDLSEARSAGQQEAEGKKRVPDADLSAALGSGRASRRSSQHAKTTTHRTRSRSSPRTSAARTEKQTGPAAGRVLPLPEPSERQRRRALPDVPGQPAPLQIAPDPYDNEK